MRLRILDVLMGLADDMLLPANQRRHFVEALVGFAFLAAGHFQYVLAEGAHLQEIDF